MLTKRFLLSWIFSSIVMYLLSYFWHGMFLNDYDELNYPKEIFLIFAIVVYLVVGFVVTKGTDITFLTKHFKRKPLIRGMIVGGVCGMFLFIMALVIGISFSKEFVLKNMLFDLSWQVVEQMIGGLVVGIIHHLVIDPTAIFED